MRQFRGLRKDKPTEWVYGMPVERKNGIIVMTWLDENDCFCAHSVLKESVGQVTGLKDKAEVDSFEGNVVNYEYWIQTSSNPEHGKVFNGVGQIKFIEGCFMIDPIGEENPIPMHFADLSFEIIGSIHTNPELIK